MYESLASQAIRIFDWKYLKAMESIKWAFLIEGLWREFKVFMNLEEEI